MENEFNSIKRKVKKGDQTKPDAFFRIFRAMKILESKKTHIKCKKQFPAQIEFLASHDL